MADYSVSENKGIALCTWRKINKDFSRKIQYWNIYCLYTFVFENSIMPKTKKIQSLFCTDLSPKYLLKVKEIVAGMHSKVLKFDSIFRSMSPSLTSQIMIQKPV